MLIRNKGLDTLILGKAISNLIIKFLKNLNKFTGLTEQLIDGVRSQTIKQTLSNQDLNECLN